MIEAHHFPTEILLPSGGGFFCICIMPATVLIRRLTGAGQTATDITSINTRANAADAHSTNDTASPITIPPSGTNYSYWVTTRLDCTVAPSGTIDNLRWYSDGSNNFGTGVTCKGQEATSYVQATGSAGNGTQLTTGNRSEEHTSELQSQSNLECRL